MEFNLYNEIEIDKICDNQYYRKKLKIIINDLSPDQKCNLMLKYYKYGMDFKRIINLFSCKTEHITEILINLDIKRCSICKEIKSRSEFDPHIGFDGLYSQCKLCERQTHKTDKAKDLRKIRNQLDNYKLQNREYQRKRKQDPIYRLNSNFSSLLARTLKKYTQSKVVKGFQHWEDLVGYTLNDLINHLESQFYKDYNMSWDNYGTYWHVDHIIARSLFTVNELGDEEFKKCWDLTNLQPLYGPDNLKKSNKLLG